MKRAVIFDLDGTLLDTIDDLGDSMNSVLRQNGFPTHDQQAYKGFIGDGLRMLVVRSLPEQKRQDTTVESCVGAMRSAYGAGWHVKTQLYDGIAELLQTLSQLGVTMSVLSNKPDDFTKKMVARFFRSGQFKCVKGAIDGLPRKPDPHLALLVAEAQQIPESETCFLGDSGTDMQTARRAGMHPIGALWGFRAEAELIENGAVAVIGHPLELVDYIHS